jgi:cell wall-associated NlpC family hydrolase|uniref:C40 family peptidase n=1 Tax=Nonlabens sp. Ci31 TaxID=2608253 RepID=UPI001F10C48E|nr:C40 family peptidase [Nonlabens sp. Ci31]
MRIIIPLSYRKYGINFFLFCLGAMPAGRSERETNRKQNNSNKKSVPIVLLSLMLLLYLGLTSCGSSRPRVITTKKEAAQAPRASVYKSPKTHGAETEGKEIEEAQMEVESNDKPYAESTPFIDEVVENAMRYKGVKYRYGGTTTKGMDCSGLICTAFEEAGKSMPRSSRSMYSKADELDLDQVRKGDFLFFATGKNKRQVNHVALITKVTPGEIEFIHSTTSRGVMTSTLNEAYWINAFLRAGRID